MLPYIIGIDIGTGSAKAVATSLSGIILTTAQVFYPPAHNLQTMNLEAAWSGFAGCIKQVVQQLGAPPKAISLSSAMHSIMAIDEKGEPLSDMITWADDRAADIAEKLVATEAGKDFYFRCGTPIHALSPLCKIRWWREFEPQLHAKAAFFIGIKEWIWHQLFGFYEIDFSLAAATGMLEIETCTWYEPALAFAGISKQKLSHPVDTSFCRNGLTDAAAAHLGLPSNIQFIIGASDGCLANMGSHVFEKGTAAVTIGTSGAVRVTSPKPGPVFPGQLFNYYLQPGAWVIGGAINNGGAAIKWIQKILGDKWQKEELENISEVPAGSDGLLFLPYLMGERAPLWDSNSSAAFIGLRQEHQPRHLLRAVFEGICFSIRSVLALLEKHTGQINQLHLSGGFTQSAAAMQILADCLGKKVILLQTEDASALGAAFLGIMAIKPDFKLPQMQAAAATYYPAAAAHERYNELFVVYNELYPLLRPVMHQLRKAAAFENK